MQRIVIHVVCDEDLHIAASVPGESALVWVPSGSPLTVLLPEHECPRSLQLQARARIHTQQLPQTQCDVLLADGVLHLSQKPNTTSRVPMMHTSSVCATEVCVLTCTQVQEALNLCDEKDSLDHDSRMADEIVEETSLTYSAQSQDLGGMSRSVFSTGGKMFTSSCGKLPLWAMLANPSPPDVKRHSDFLLRLTQVCARVCANPLCACVLILCACA